ncbi:MULTISPECIES: hypothetical protein [unclassified Spirosoma]|uniref:sodium:solute symporter family protein n=1 Tax=unclassified Spirosoma TaxID=2621999 RepID=UPI000B21967D|nr:MULTISPECIES: hypothetical protein [unclassified Spirosoma]
MAYFSEHATVLICMVVYLISLITFGWYLQRQASKTVGEYYVADRRIPGWVVSLAFFSTFVSTNTYIGQAGESFRYGLSWTWVGVFWAVFCIISWQILGPRMRNQSIRLKSFTVPDYFQLRYQSQLSRSIRVLSAVIILFATVWYMTGIAKGCAHLLQSLLDIPYAYGAAFMLFFTCFYTIAGGMYGIMWTDAVQGILMFIVAIIMLALPFIYVGGYDALMAKIAFVDHVSKKGAPIGNGLVTFGQLTSFTYIVGIGLSIGMKQISEPKLLIRFYTVKDKAGMKFAMTWTPIFMGVSLVCVMGLGALVHGMVSSDEAAQLINNTDEVVGFMLKKFNNPLISGICLMGLFAAGMAALASVTLVVGTTLVKDIWNVWQPMPVEKIIPRTKVVMLLYCIIVYYFTIFPPADVVELSAFAGSVYVASFFPTIFGGLYFRWGTDLGAVASMLAGIVVNIVWRFGVRTRYENLGDIHEVFPAFLASFVAYVLVSQLTAQRKPTQDHLATVFGEESKLDFIPSANR